MKEYINKFLDYSKNVLFRKKDVLRHYYYDLLQFDEWIKFKKNKNLINTGDIHTSDCIEYLQFYSETKNVSQSTIAEKSNTLRCFFKWVALMDYPTLVNVDGIPIIKKQRGKVDMITETEYRIFYNAVSMFESDPAIILRNQLLIEIPYRTGLRRAEVLRLKWEMFDNPNRQFQLEVKGGFIENCFFSEQLKDKIDKYYQFLSNTTEQPSKNDYIFKSLSNRNKGVLTCLAMDNIFVKYSEKLKEIGLLNRRIRPHMLRHSFATNCVYKGLSQQAVSRLMHHRDPKTTEQYYHLNNSWLLGQFDLLNA